MGIFSNVVGIDVSKLTLDAYDHRHQAAIQVNNTPAGFKGLIKWLKQRNNVIDDLLICFEHTGLYSLPLAVFLNEKQISFAMVPGLEIKYSLGLTRGKNDQVDARRIAEYAYLRRDTIKLYKLPSTNLLELKNLLALREKMITHRAGYKTTQKEMKLFSKQKSSSLIFKAHQQIIKDLTHQIQAIEKQIKNIIETDHILKNTFELVTSVKGVGLIVGASMLVYTNCFTTFKDWRKFASYCGIAPFDHQSGTSIKGKKRTSHLANKKLKALLSNAASSSIVHNGEMKVYYNRRIMEGKNKMSTQNIIRNKLVSRMFAAVLRGTPYVDTFRFAA